MPKNMRDIMRIGIIGPSNVKAFCKASGMDENDYINEVLITAKTIAETKNKIIVVPQKKSISEIFAKEYKKSGGAKVFGLIPMDDTEFGIELLDEETCDEIINCVTWRNQVACLSEKSDLLLCLGFGAGTLGEICITKYFRSKVIVIEEFITQRLPKEAERDLDVKYIRLKDIGKEL
jgi:predicted Rossmann-fold nucleotide-binding protein